MNLSNKSTRIDESSLEEFFLDEKKDLSNLESDILLDRIRRDHGVSFYKVGAGDTLYSIWNRCKKIQGYKYLDDDYYNPSTREFKEDKETGEKKQVHRQRNKLGARNIDTQHLEPGMMLPIPMDYRIRKLSILNYQNLVGSSIDLLDASSYSNITPVLKANGLEHISKFTKTFLEKESSFGANASYRYEKHHKSFSFTSYHFLFNSGSPFEIAKNKLNFTTGEIMTDIRKATAVFLAGIYEKFKDMSGSKTVKKKFPNGFEDVFNQDNVFNAAWRYNGFNKNGEEYAKQFLKMYNTQTLETSTNKMITSSNPKQKIHVEEKKKGAIESTIKSGKIIDLSTVSSDGARVYKYTNFSGLSYAQVNKECSDLGAKILITDINGEELPTSGLISKSISVLYIKAYDEQKGQKNRAAYEKLHSLEQSLSLNGFDISGGEYEKLYFGRLGGSKNYKGLADYKQTDIGNSSFYSVVVHRSPNKSRINDIHAALSENLYIDRDELRLVNNLGEDISYDDIIGRPFVAHFMSPRWSSD